MFGGGKQKGTMLTENEEVDGHSKGELKYSSLELTSLPSILLSPTIPITMHTHTIDLSRNSLSSLSPSIYLLVSLTSLDCSRNRIKEISAGIGRLTKLKRSQFAF